MKNKIIFIIAVLIGTVMIYSRCKKEGKECPNVSLSNENLQGKWKHHYGTYENTNSFIRPPKFSFEFFDDSFKMSINQFSDLIADSNGCNYLNWKEYVKGKFIIENSKVYMTGYFCDSNYDEKLSDCYRIGVYKDSFSGYFCNDTLTLNWENSSASETEKRPIRLTLE